METKGRHFILKHEKCGGIFTINSDKFIKYLDNKEGGSLGICPSCGEKTLKLDTLKELLETYCFKQNILAENGYTIREINEPIDPENMLTIVNILKLYSDIQGRRDHST